jgi:lysophospholipase L1-like esterase/predicted neuraminidase
MASGMVVVAFGDSTTALRPTVPSVYAQILQDQLPDLLGKPVTVYNAGIPGNNTNNATARLDADVRVRNPDVVIVQFGINDAWVDSQVQGNASRVPLGTYTANLRNMVNTLEGDGARVILMTTNQLATSGFSPAVPQWQVDLLSTYNQAARGVAASENVELLDVWQRYSDYAASPGHSINDLLVDAQHPNQVGHQLVADGLLPMLVPEPSATCLISAGAVALLSYLGITRLLHRRRCRPVSQAAGAPGDAKRNASVCWRSVAVFLACLLSGAADPTRTSQGAIVCTDLERSVLASNLPGMAIPCIAPLSDGRLFAVWSTGGASIVGAYSADNGVAWTAPQTLIATSGGHNWDPNIIVSGQRIIVASTVTAPGDAITTSTTRANRSDDNGATWTCSPSTPYEIPMNHRYTSGKVGRGLRLPSGRLLMPYSWDAALEDGGAASNSVHCRAGVMISTDDGLTWSNGGDTDYAPSGTDEPQIVQMPDNSVCMLMRTASGRLYQARSFDEGTTWNDVGPSLLTSPDAPAGLCTFDAGGRQAMLAVWNNSTANRYPLVAAASLDGGNTWTSPFDIAGDTGGYQACYANVLQTGDGKMVLVWNQQTANGWDVRSARFSCVDVPEPSAMTMLSVGAISLALLRTRTRSLRTRKPR